MLISIFGASKGRQGVGQGSGLPTGTAKAHASASHDLPGELLAVANRVAAAMGHHGQVKRVDQPAGLFAASPTTMSALAVFVAEAVRNAVRHAHPAGATGIIRVGCHRAARGDVVVEIYDDGIGLPPHFDPARHGGAGCSIMRGIATELGAALTFRSSPLGLRLRLRLPAATVRSDSALGAPDNLLQALQTPIYVTDAEGGIIWFNPAAAGLWGRQPVLGEKWCGSWRLRWPDGRPMAHDECPLAATLRGGEERPGVEVIVERPDGSRVPLIQIPTLLRDAAGNVTGAVNLGVEIAERKLAEQRQQLLTGEMQHRAKNLFAIAHAVVSQSLRGAPMEQARSAVLGRLHALAETYAKLSATAWQGAALGEVVHDELDAFAGQVEIDGPEITLNPRAAQNFALAVHELATNAAKHGALSVPNGRVAISWWIAGEGAELRFRWAERGGPPVNPPTQKGFGSVVLEQVIAQDFGHPPAIVFAPDGLTYELTTKFDRIAALARGNDAR